MSSMNPNDPFEDHPDPPATEAPKKKGGRVLIWVIGLFGGFCFLSLLCCCGGGYWLLGMLSDSYRQKLNANPVIAEHLGEIESLSINFSKTAEEAENPNCDIAYDAKGSLASGTILIKQDGGGDGTEIAAAELILADGTRHQVPIGGGQAPVIDDFDVDMGEVDLGEIDSQMEELKESIPAP